MNIVQKTITKLDSLQRRHFLPAFTFAVIKKYGEDEAGYQAALLTYYSFLSLFPLLLVLTTLTTIIAGSHSHLQDVIIRSTSTYFPILGDQLSAHVHTIHKEGLALLIGILFTMYGTRGVADALRHGVQHIWGVPKVQRDGFPKSVLKSLSVVIVGGLGFILAAAAAGIASSAGHQLGFRLLSVVLNVFILFWLFTFLLNISLPRHISIRQTRAGAAFAAVGLVIVQSFGTYLLAHELKNLDALYSYFALSLGLLFWIYLQVQTLFYALEIAAVKAHHLWPRSLSGELTPADKKAYALQATEQQILPEERISTAFKNKT